MNRALLSPRRTALLLLVALAAVSVPASAGPPAASCCLQSTSAVDALLNPAQGSDEKFFSPVGGAPNVMFVVGSTSTMHRWPLDLNANGAEGGSWRAMAKGCGDTRLNGFGYLASNTYESMWSTYAARNPAWFNSSLYYPVPDRGYGTNFVGAPTGPTYPNRLSACTSVTGISLADTTACDVCLSTKGYYVYNATTRLASGNFLNFYGPRDASMISVLSQVAHDINPLLRMGVIGLKRTTNTGCAGSDNCICLLNPIKPTCANSTPVTATDVDAQRDAIIRTLQTDVAWDPPTDPRCGTALADMLLGADYYYASRPNPWGTTPAPLLENAQGGDKSICNGCSFNATVILTDAENENEGQTGVGGFPVGQGYVPCEANGNATTLCSLAKYFWTNSPANDFRSDYAGNQRRAVYAVGYSFETSTSGTLQTTATVGGGLFLGATSAFALKKAIADILKDIQTRNTSFAGSSIASLQTSSASLNATVPRMQPLRSRPWQGQLYRFTLYNERLKDTEVTGDTAGQPGFKNDIVLLDRNNALVTEDTDGRFVVGGATPATPFWEASAVMKARGHAARTIYSVIENATPDGRLDSADTRIAFTSANAAALLPYLGIATDNFCPSGTSPGAEGKLLGKLGVGLTSVNSICSLPTEVDGGIATVTQAQLDECCAKVLIEYVRGRDLADEDEDNNRAETRDSVLGDIFHSAPVVAEPPIPKFLCDLGIHNQCVRTLYSKQLGIPSTPLADATGNEPGCSTPIPGDAYDVYLASNRRRDKVLLVGANDGMLHAFMSGAGTRTCTGAPAATYDEGTGEEVWAFIPPDLLPRLKDLPFGHTYMVDGDIMVRDIWADGNSDGVKQPDEFHTMAVVAEGRGGTHYFALELAWAGATDKGAAAAPNFRWMFPQPCTPEAASFGKTLYSLSPKPPPIGPILLDSTIGGMAEVATRNVGQSTAGTSERWVAVLSGGWSPGLERGRGVYVVDAWSAALTAFGGRQDNLWWKFEFDNSSSGPQRRPQNALTHSVVAPVAMVDYGDNDAPRLDGFFDTALFGDTKGQLWTLRLHEPGTLDSSNGDVTRRVISNWAGARAFQQDRDSTSTPAADDAGVPPIDSNSVRSQWPIYYLPSVGIQPDNGALRAFVGTGDRYNLLEPRAGTCRFDNPLACAKYGCSTTEVEYEVTKNDFKWESMETKWTAYTFDKAKAQRASASKDVCGAAPGDVVVNAEFDERKIENCPNASGPVTNPGNLGELKYECGRIGTGGAFGCRRTDSETANFSDVTITPSAATLAALGNNRMYGVWAYGGKLDRTFDEALTSASAQSAASYDSRRLTDRGGDAGTGDLVDVSTTACSAPGVCTGPTATAEGSGWLLDYPALEHRTAGGAALVASCVLWNTVLPAAPSAGDGGCTTLPVAQARLYQAGLITGAPDCAADFKASDGGFARFAQRNVLAPPPEPGVAIQIGAGGQITMSVVTLEPGSAKAIKSDVAVSSDMLQTIYELPVSRDLHRCRHESGDGGMCRPMLP